MLAPTQRLGDLTDLLAHLGWLLRDGFFGLPWFGGGRLCFGLGAEVQDHFLCLLLLGPNEEVAIIEIVRGIPDCLGGVRIELQDAIVKRIFLSMPKGRGLLEVL